MKEDMQCGVLFLQELKFTRILFVGSGVPLPPRFILDDNQLNASVKSMLMKEK